jgi:hypothetical protein
MRKLILLLLCIHLASNIFGQISHDADTVLPVDYNSEVGHDSILVVFGPGLNGFSDTLHLEAYFPFGQSGKIQWFSLDRNLDDTTLIETPLIEHPDTSYLPYSTIFNGGYRVYISNDIYDTVITFWAYFNNLEVKPYYEKSCNELAIYGISGGVDFYYYNPDTVTINEVINNAYEQQWEDYYFDPSSSNYVLLDSLEFNSETTPPDQANQYFPTPPLEYDNYMLTVNVFDSLGHRGSDTLYYQAIAVQVDFEVSKNDETLPADQLKFSGPANVAFRNLTKNAEFYEWTFFNDTNRINNGADTTIRTSTFFEPLDSVKYTYPGKYDVKLRAEGPIFIENGEERSCVDSVTQPLYITIYNSFVGELPTAVVPESENVFYFKDIESWDYAEYQTPEGLATVSIKKVEVYVYNRYGMRVFYYEGDGWNIEDAWDGTRKGKRVSSGVYYYWIKALGYDDRLFEKKGFFHVFDSKTN